MAREMVFAHMQVGVFVVDEQRTIVDANLPPLRRCWEQ